MFTIYLSHHSISRSAEYKAETLAQAKQIAEEKFGDGFLDHKMVIADTDGFTVASKVIGDGDWSEH